MISDTHVRSLRENSLVHRGAALPLQLAFREQIHNLWLPFQEPL